jgi:hypothetical protein
LEETDNTEPDSAAEEQKDDEEEDEALLKEAKRKKARLRTRGPYRKAHADW